MLGTFTKDGLAAVLPRAQDRGVRIPIHFSATVVILRDQA
jgi:hypothetical protein